ncbi:hypothetical protein CALCODRAFT_507089 [Calocera cornea HHB12733]|uniref:Uncharacterized protein n=1 Tax=Calocera cornea HHB12733 TaxID=1353952 RepID=A0A165I445_9BASI|nr:hypothetical protein CALCODRAFT_507089 [Calocera cornea HHB12733]
MCQRIDGMHHYTDRAHGVSYITNFPDNLSWGHSQGYNMSNYLATASCVQKLLAKPPQETIQSAFLTIIANKFQTVFGSDEPGREFVATFNAQLGMKPRKDLAHYPAASLKKSDFVFLEIKIKKRFDKEAAQFPKEKQTWSINFTLSAVFLLEEGTGASGDDNNVTYNF